jgi:NADPH-dependent 2,4-dienoyl-CoA reductase/sulfur reductase-like enzyme
VGEKTHYVVVGNGICGMEAALVLRRRDEDARITIVSDESDHFFSRPALMYVFAGQMRLQDTEPYDRDLYGRMGFERVRGRAVRLAPPNLCFEDGTSIRYDRLLLATGSVAREPPWPGAQGQGVHRFVTLGDLEALDREGHPGRRAVVIGGGLIGIEVAEILQRRGLNVTFLIREDWYFPLALDRAESSLVAEHMRGHGMDVRLGENALEILRELTGSVRAVKASSGEIPCDLVVVAIGVVPRTEFLRGSVELSEGGAIEVDDALKTSVKDVWAAGDCANVTWPDGKRRPEQLWYTAREQGRLVATSMLGDRVFYRRGIPFNSAKFFDLEWTTVGFVPVRLNWDNTEVALPEGTRTWFQRVPGRFESQRIILEGERVVGFNMLGSRWDHEILLGWIAERRSLPHVLDHLRDAQFDEEFTPRFKVHPGAGIA